MLHAKHISLHKVLRLKYFVIPTENELMQQYLLVLKE